MSCPRCLGGSRFMHKAHPDFAYEVCNECISELNAEAEQRQEDKLKEERIDMSKGTFQQRLDQSIATGDVVTIVRYETPKDNDDGDFFIVEVTSESEKFGKLKQHEDVLVDKATPGKLVSAIEDVTAKLTNAVETISSAQAPEDE